MKYKGFNFWRWTPIIASVIVLIMIGIISRAAISELRSATKLRKHTLQVILDAQTFEDGLIDSENRVRDYVASGKPSLIVEYRKDTNSELREFNELIALTRDNPAQEKRLKELYAATRAVFEYDNRVIGMYAKQGAEAARRIEDSSGSMDVQEAAIADMEKFKTDETGLLDKQDTTEQQDYHRAARVLVLGSLIVAVLLVVANFVAGREMACRRQSEMEQRDLVEKLRMALADVKTMSGLIPICGWCKNVRNDAGYWQSVEQYVRAHTDATFSHGMCPSCSEKFKADVAKANKNPASSSPIAT